ncbi:MAG TPA: P1 family peptidase [Candidatus Acidoferrales bacterium]|nr:P1 family peptidase [Candidatus Acidoferrales bacterium]
MANITRRGFHQSVVAGVASELLGPMAALAGDLAPESAEPSGSITDVPGISVGHFTDKRRPTGCTVLLFGKEGAATGVDYDGSAPGTYQVALLQPVSFIEEIWGIVLSGGSSFGLATAPGVVRYLEEQKIGLPFGIGLVPIVCGAIIYDLGIGGASVRPDAEAGYQACLAASTKPVEQGNVGAGAGATVGKMLYGMGVGGMKSGVGSASLKVGDVVIAALMVVNAVGDIVDWRSGKIIAGARRKDGKGFMGIPSTLITNPPVPRPRAALLARDPVMGSTTIGVVATNATFNKTEMTKIAMMANCGAARCINPYHTPGDGDTLFAVSTRRMKTDLSVSVVGALAAEAVSRAVVQSAKMAASIEGWPAYDDYTAKLG